MQQFTQNGSVTGCGLTFFGTEKVQVGRALVFNGSAVIFKTGAVLVKGRVSEVEAKVLYSPNFNLRDVKPLKTDIVWFKASASAATTPLGPVKDAEDKGYIIYGTKFDTVFPVLRSVLMGESIQIGFKAGSEKSEKVMFGVVEVSTEEKDQLKNCMGELAG